MSNNQTYKVKVFFKRPGNFGDLLETHLMSLSRYDVNDIRVWLANYYKVGHYDIKVYKYEIVK
jgi:hypothetical protein